MEDTTSIPIFDLNSTEAWPFGLSDNTSEFQPHLLVGSVSRTKSESVVGDTLLCQCPECSALLSVRVWLLTADCWNCRASILLSELEVYRERESASEVADRRLILDQGKELPRRSDATIGETGNRKNLPTAKPHGNSKVRQIDLIDRKARLRRRHVALPRTNRKRSIFSDAPSLLASLLLHLLLLLILALLTLRRPVVEESITLSTSVGPVDREDMDAQFVDPVVNIAYDLPVPQADQPKTEKQRKSLIRADEDAKTLRMDPEAEAPELPDLFALKRAIGIDPNQRNFAVRDPRIRVEMIRREGGTTLTEAAVARGLKWLASHQNNDGSWSLDRFSRSPSCRGQCSGNGQTRSDTAATSLALLPFLGAGQTHVVGRYKDVVSTGLRWLIKNQKKNGDLSGKPSGNAGMYAHGQSAIVLCEAYALTQDEFLRRPAELAIEFIEYAQHPGGGWRYSPKEPGDTSVFGWQLMALQSARSAGLSVHDETMELASHYLDTCSYQDGATYSYRPSDRNPTAAMTAEALLCRMYLGWDLSNPALRDGIGTLLQKSPPHTPRHHSEFTIYYWYYATQVMHHAGGRSWKLWNQQIRDILVESQEKYGHEAGSWDTHGPHGQSGGRIYVTSLAVCTLEVYYRHAPIFRRIDLQ